MVGQTTVGKLWLNGVRIVMSIGADVSPELYWVAVHRHWDFCTVHF